MVKDVVLYTSYNCPKCQTTKEFLKDNEINYTEKNILDKESYRQDVIDLGYRQVPVIVIDGEDFSGTEIGKIAELLDI